MNEKFSDYKQNCVEFSGTPSQHPTDASKILLVEDALDSQCVTWTFDRADVGSIEEVFAKVRQDPQGAAVVQVYKVWVKKGAHSVVSKRVVVS